VDFGQNQSIPYFGYLVLDSERRDEENPFIFTSLIATTMIQFCLIAVVVFFSLFFYAAAKFHRQTTAIAQ